MTTIDEKLNVSDIIDKFSRDVDITSEEFLAVQLIPRALIFSIKQLLKGVLDSIDAFINKENIARRLSLEVLLRTLGVRRISQALSKVKTSKAKCYWLIIISKNKIPLDLRDLCSNEKLELKNEWVPSKFAEYQSKVRAELIEDIMDKELLETLSIPFLE